MNPVAVDLQSATEEQDVKEEHAGGCELKENAVVEDDNTNGLGEIQ
jgi:hypothetical protein